VLDAGGSVVIFTRRARPDREGVTHRVWQPHREPVDPAHLDGLDAVVNLVGEPVLGRWTADKKRRLRESRVDATRNLVARWSEIPAPPRVLVSGSAIGYYGDRGETPVDEDTPAADDFLGRLSLDWESEALPVEGAGTRLVWIRTGLVLDPDHGLLQPMLLPWKLGLGATLGSGRQYMSWIHRDDWVGLVRLALENASVRGPLNGTAPHPVRNVEFTRTLARVLGRPAPWRIPAGLIRLALGEMSREVLGGSAVHPRRALDHGYVFSFPRLEAALAHLLGKRAA
jgi:uncharacterized protein (TIGR01777 family)